MNVGVRAMFHVPRISWDEFERSCDVIMQTLVTLEGQGGVSDAAVSVNLETCTVEIELVGHRETFEAARAAAESAVHSAIQEGVLSSARLQYVHIESMDGLSVDIPADAEIRKDGIYWSPA